MRIDDVMKLAHVTVTPGSLIKVVADDGYSIWKHSEDAEGKELKAYTKRLYITEKELDQCTLTVEAD